MDMPIKVNSSIILEIDWHKYDWNNDGNLYVKFKKGEVTYRYYDVPKSVWEAFKASESKGSFFYQNIKPRYKFRRV